MQISNSRFEQHVAASGTPRYRHVSEGFAKHLPYQHPYSTRFNPQDQSDGMIPSGVCFVVDGVFAAKARNAAFKAKNGGADDFPANGERIAMIEWPTSARIRDIRIIASTAAMNPGSFNLNYFDADTAAAFPTFTLQAMDPNDSSFTPIPLLDTVSTTVNVESPGSGTVIITRQQLSLAALAYGVNRRKDPLIIEAVLGGNVVNNSLLYVAGEFVIPHT